MQYDNVNSGEIHLKGGSQDTDELVRVAFIPDIPSSQTLFDIRSHVPYRDMSVIWRSCEFIRRVESYSRTFVWGRSCLKNDMGTPVPAQKEDLTDAIHRQVFIIIIFFFYATSSVRNLVQSNKTDVHLLKVMGAQWPKFCARKWKD